MGTRLSQSVASLVVHPLNAAATRVQVIHDGSGEFVGDGDLDVFGAATFINPI
jgi:hypothetical protein